MAKQIAHYYASLDHSDFRVLCGDGMGTRGSFLFVGAPVLRSGRFEVCELCALLHLAEPDNTPTFEEWNESKV